MATFKTNAYSNRYLAVDLTVASQSTASNSSKVKWRLYGGGGSANNYITSGNFKLVVGGVTRYSSAKRINMYGNMTIASGEFTITHNNDGKKSLAVSLQAGIYTTAVNCTGSGTFTLPAIARGTTINSFNLATRGLNYQSISYSTAHTCDTSHYRLNGGNWVSLGDGNFTSINKTITNLKPNTTYTLQIQVRRKDTQIWTQSATKTFTTYPVARLTNIKDVVIGDLKSSFTLTNEAGYTWSLQLEKENGDLIKKYDDIKNNGSYTIDTPPANQLYQLTPNSNELTLYYKVSYTQNNEVISARYPIKFLVTNSNPTFNDFDYIDSNTTTSKITGNNKVFIQGISTPKITVTSSQQMKANNYATASSYQITFDEQTKSINSGTTFTDTLLAPTKAGIEVLSVKAVDSRGNSKTVNKNVEVLKYSKPEIYGQVDRVNNFEKDVVINCSGKFEPLIVNGVAKNELEYAYYFFREGTEDGWKEWQNGGYLTVTQDKEKGTYNCTQITRQMDNKKYWQVQLQVKDKLTVYLENFQVSAGVPIFFISDSHKAIGVNCVPPSHAEPGSIWSNGEDIMSVVKEQQAEILYLKDVVDRLSYDTGWVDLQPNTSNLENQTAYGQSRIRRIGDVVTLFLSVKPTTNLDLRTNYNLFLLPEEFRPSSAFMSAGATVLGSASLQNTDITINEGGQVTIRISGTQTSKVAPSVNIAGTITWFVN